MGTIRPHLWFDREAREAAEYYVSTFPGSQITHSVTLHDTPSGDAEVISFELFGQRFMAISAGPLFTFTPALSFLVSCETKEEVDEYWTRLSDGGTALMPLGSYPFSAHYGWTEDRYGLSWQVGLEADGARAQRITPTLMFVGSVCGKAEDAMRYYTSIFPRSEVGEVVRYSAGEEPDREGTLKYGAFALAGQRFAAMDSARGHDFSFNEAISLMVECDKQNEIDHYWEALSAVPEAEQCGWLKDRYGLSWQIVPTAMDEIMRSASEEQMARVTAAFLAMRKFDIAALRDAFEGR